MAEEPHQQEIEFIPRTRPFVSAATSKRERPAPDKSTTIPDGARRLCASVDIAGWSTWGTSGARAEATEVLAHALRLTGDSVDVPVKAWTKHPAGDGWLIVFPADLDESAMIAALVRTVTAKLAEYNDIRPAGRRLRVRLSVAQGTLHATEAGFCDDVTIGVSRLVDCSALRAALADYPASDLAVIVSDDVYHDVVKHDRHGPTAKSFWPVVATGKKFRAPAWIHVPDRAGGPHRPSEADQIRQETPARRGPGPAWIVDLLPTVFPGWAAVPADIAPEERIEPDRVREVVDGWRRALAEPGAAHQVPPPSDKEQAAVAEAAELVGCGRFRSAFDLVATQLADAPGARCLPVALARVLVLADPGRHADAVQELLDWVLVHRVEGPADTTEPLLLRAENAYAIGRLEAALIDLSQVLEVLPESSHRPGPAALLRLGDCHAQLGDPAGAAAAWRRLLVARPVHPHASLRLGYLALAGNDPDEAQRQLRRADQFLRARRHTDRRTMEHAVSLGLYAAHRAKGEDAAAEHHLDYAAKLLPDDPVTAAEQAMLAADKGDTQNRQRFTRLAVARAEAARHGLPVLDLLHDTGLLDDDRHRTACATHRERH